MFKQRTDGCVVSGTFLGMRYLIAAVAMSATALIAGCGSGTTDSKPESTWPKESFTERVSYDDMYEFSRYLVTQIGGPEASKNAELAPKVCEILHEEPYGDKHDSRFWAEQYVGLIAEPTTWNEAVFVDAAERLLCPLDRP